MKRQVGLTNRGASYYAEPFRAKSSENYLRKASRRGVSSRGHFRFVRADERVHASA